jgi:hypothetical protein
MSIFKHLLLAACALALLGGCASNPDTSSASPAATQDPPADQVAKNQQGQDVECDTEMETGSHVHRHTVCMSQQDRDAQDQAMSALRSHGSGSVSH